MARTAEIRRTLLVGVAGAVLGQVDARHRAMRGHEPAVTGASRARHVGRLHASAPLTTACPIHDSLVDSSADDSTKALAVLTLLHESYHVRHWAWRLDEARVECRAIRHFRVGIRVLGGSQQLADALFPLALDWHTQITRNPSYHLSSCRVPR